MSSRTAILVALLASSALVFACAEKIKGMAFGTGHDLVGIRQPYAAISLNNMKAAGVNYAHISAYSNMKKLEGLSLRQVTPPDDIRYAIRKVKAAGIKVFFKPAIEIDGPIWRGHISGKPEWFSKVYRPFILSMAKIAEEEKVDLFAVGSEYARTLDRTAEWLQTIREVRAVYKGKLTYVANHDRFKKIKFWHALDVISLSAYFVFRKGTYGPSPNMTITKKLWENIARQIGYWRYFGGYADKKVLLAEVGFQSKGRGVVYRVPYQWNIKAPKNDYEQVKMYEGLLGAFMPKKWVSGVILWHWKMKPNAGKIAPWDVDYTPQGKPALAVMKKYYFRKYHD